MQQSKQFLSAATKLLGNKFIAISSEESTKFGTDEKDGIKMMISIQDEESIVFLDLIQVKVRNTNPSISKTDLEKIKGQQVKFKNLRIGIYNSQFTFSAEDVFLMKNGGDSKWDIK